MNSNMSKTDRTVRFLAGGVMLAYGVVFQNFVGAVGLIPLVTAYLGTCPFYDVLGISTNRYGD